MKDKSLASLDNQVIILKGCSVNLYLEPRGGKNFVLRSEVRVQALVIANPVLLPPLEDGPAVECNHEISRVRDAWWHWHVGKVSRYECSASAPEAAYADIKGPGMSSTSSGPVDGDVILG